MTFAGPPRRLPRAILLLGSALVVAHVMLNLFTPYGVHRDEFLYMAMGERLQLWRMDFPPFIAIASNAQRALFGDALWSIRLLPALVGTVLLWCAVRAALLLAPDDSTASTRSAWIVVCATLPSGVFLRPAAMFQPVVFDQLWWTLALLALVERQRRADARWWIAVGAALGLGLLTKLSIAFIGVGIVVGALLTPLRRDLVTRWPWVALVIALAIGSPSLVGQIALDWPVLWQMRDLSAEQLGRRRVFAFLTEQLSLVGPIGMLLAAYGWWWLWRAPAAQAYRAIGIATAVSWFLLIVQRGKGYYGAPVYPMLFAAGAVALIALEQRSVHASRRRRVVIALCVLNVALGAIGLPLTLPILSPASTARFAERLGATESTTTNTGTQLALPQDYADMLGWEEQVRAVADEWRALSDADRERAVLAASNYGRAGALDFYGPRYGLPRVVSGAGSYWYFGPGTRRGDVLIAVGGGDELRRIWSKCRVLRTVGTRWAVEEEQRVEILRCDGPSMSLQALWPMFNPAAAGTGNPGGPPSD